MGLSGKAQERAFLEPLECEVDQHTLTHSFQYVPEYPVPLLGRDIADISHKLGAAVPLMGGKLEGGVPIDKGHKRMMLMAGDKPPRTEQVDLPGAIPITIWTPHQVPALLSPKGTQWLSPEGWMQMQAVLLDNPVATTNTGHTLNPATQLHTETGPLEHDRIETTDTIDSSGPEAGSECRPNPKEEWSTERSIFMRKGKRLGGHAVTSQTQVIDTRSLPRDFCPKGGADSPHLSLRARDREDVECLHRF